MDVWGLVREPSQEEIEEAEAMSASVSSVCVCVDVGGFVRGDVMLSSRSHNESHSMRVQGLGSYGFGRCLVRGFSLHRVLGRTSKLVPLRRVPHYSSTVALYVRGTTARVPPRTL